MKIYETENYEEMSRKAANILSAQVILKPSIEGCSLQALHCKQFIP